ncbi:TLC domain-containing protein [Aspergillus karnatakaensis]|uniref:TLC domain-containing protein n=1 Tax=Aspergillus karnatakaensis TaxID=1810916 RepID=UPI003CCDB2C3
MLDPIPAPPEWLREIVDPWALRLNAPVLADHFHEVIVTFLAYLLIHYVLSPWLSPKLFPNHYPKLNKRTKLNWDVHVVSLVQSTFINAVALWVLFVDEERKSMTPAERVYGYTGSCVLISSLAVGYFIYDLIVSTIYVNMFGIGMLFHAVSALWVFSFGYRPFVNFYAPVFILYELSSPFLNIHWFLDKVNMTGSSLQWYNGMALLAVFFCCRLVWGTWQSVIVYSDMFAALQQTWSASPTSPFGPVDIMAQVFQARDDGSVCINEACVRANAEISKYSKYTAGGVPTWLVLTYVTSNLILNGLNYYWFGKMVETVLKRFRGPAASTPQQAPVKDTKNHQDHNKENSTIEDLAQQAVLDAASKLEEEEGSLFLGDNADSQTAASGVDAGLSQDLRSRKTHT